MFIHSSVDKHRGCFSFLAVINSAENSEGSHRGHCVDISFHYFWIDTPTGMTGSNVKFMSNLLKTAKLLFKVVAAFYTPLLLFSHSVVSGSLTPWPAARQASLSITSSRSLLKLMSIELVMPSNHLILCCPLPLPPSVIPNIRIFSSLFTSGGQGIGPEASASASVLPVNIQS